MSSQLLIVAATFLLTFFGLGAAGLAYSGPVAVVAGVAAMAWANRRHEAPWTSIGLGKPPAPVRFALTTVGSVLAGWAAAGAAMVLAVKGLGWAPMDVSRIAIEGNVPVLLTMLALSWTTAAVGEEILFRGFLRSRVQALLGNGRHAGLIAVLVQAALFGLAHAYQGPTGILMTAGIGLAFGLIVLRTRSLWPVIVAHGLVDTISLLSLFAGAGR